MAANIDEFRTDRTGSTRAAVPLAIRAQRRNRKALTAGCVLVVVAAAVGGLVPPALALVGSQSAQAAEYQPSLADITRANRQSVAPVAAKQDAAAASLVKARVSDATVELKPTPTPTPDPVAVSASEADTPADTSEQGAPAQEAAPPAAPLVNYSPDSIQAAARDYLAANGYGADQFACFDAIITPESGWNPTIANPYSGAYGIPQALPGSKMASAGPDWQTNPMTQVKWALGYMVDRFGSPCGALAFRSANGWY